jgi:hypothetical protein
VHFAACRLPDTSTGRPQKRQFAVFTDFVYFDLVALFLDDVTTFPAVVMVPADLADGTLPADGAHHPTPPSFLR